VNQEPGSANLTPRGDLRRFAEKLGILVAVALAIWLWNTALQVVLLVFAGILFGIGMHRVSTTVAGWTRLSRRKALALVSVLLVGILVLAAWFIVPSVGKQLQELGASLPKSVQRLQETISTHAWGREALKAADSANTYMADQGTLMRKLGGMFTSTVAVAGGLALVVFLGMCFAIEPRIYTSGLLSLLPLPARPRAREVLCELEDKLAHWLLARLAAMAIVTVLSGIALWALKIPLLFTLALLAGSFDFIPNIGPFVAAAPAVLLGLTETPMKGVYVALAFFAIQTAEGYIITPIIERKTVKLPPALTAAAQLTLGLSAGLLGVALAAPLTAAVMLLVRELYVRDYLGDDGGREPPLQCRKD
jgi:predicted PurR-regulated permease PerM